MLALRVAVAAGLLGIVSIPGCTQAEQESAATGSGSSAAAGPAAAPPPSAAESASIGDAGPAARYLSELAFEGLHILERDGDHVRIFKGGQASERPLRLRAGWRTMKAARTALRKALAIPKPVPAARIAMFP